MNGLIGVAGARAEGLAAAQACARFGYRVLLYDADPETLEAAPKHLAQRLGADLRAGRVSGERAELERSRLRLAPKLMEFKAAGFVIDETGEGPAAKQALLRDLDALLPPDAVLAIDSSAGVGYAAERLLRRERVVGMHFSGLPWNPRLMEVVRTPETREEAFRSAWGLALSLERLPVEVLDKPGLIVDRLARRFFLEAQRTAAEGWGSYCAVDAALRAVAGFPQGPFESMDLAGLDSDLLLSRSIHRGLGGPKRLLPGELQERLVSMGHLGRKTSRGFYLYDAGGAAGENPDAFALLPLSSRIQSAQAISRRVLGAMAEEALLACEEGVASREAVNLAVRTAMGLPRGPFEWR